MRLVCWNVAGKIDGPRAARLSAQAQAIAGERPDVVALQEVTRASDPQWRAALARLGLPHVISTTSLLAPDRRYANLLAARWPLQPLSFRPDPDNDFPEKLLTARVQTPSTIPIDVHVFHAPTGVGSGWGKVRTLEALHRRLAQTSATPRIVCGDFNAPQQHLPGGPLITWAQDPTTRILHRRAAPWFTKIESPTAWDAERWDKAERQVLEPTGSDLVDVYRDLHPHGEDFSWVWRRGDRVVGRRYDHVLASRELRLLSMSYRHDWRERDSSESRLSDHSGVVFDFDLQG